ncbi:MAG: hypothetical protein WCL39_00035 [Armatimonadota bacterium]
MRKRKRTAAIRRTSASRRSTKTRPVAKRTYTRRTSRRKRVPWAISVKPSLVLIALGAACLAWRFVGIGGPSTTVRWLTPSASGMMGLMLVGFGLVIWWMEAAGFRDPPVAPRKSAARLMPTARKSPSNPTTEENTGEKL